MLKDLTEDQRINLAFTGRLIKGVGHNLNTPLSAIMGRAEMLQIRLNRIKEKAAAAAGEDDLEKCLKDVMLIIENSTRVSATVKNMMQKSFSAEEGQMQLVNIAHILNDDLELLAANMEFKHNIEKKIDIHDRLPSVKGIPVHFSNIFLEILDNSINSMAEAEIKKISISAKTCNGGIQVVFHDTGTGFVPHELEKVLRIVHDRSSGVVVEGGYCGGYARVSRLLKMYNADLDIQSKPGATEVRVTIPVSK